MPKKAKSVITVGTKGWEATIPRPPKHATHARMMASDAFSSDPTPKQVTLPIQDFGCFKGVSGNFYYLRMDKKRKIVQKWEKEFWYWNGHQVEDLPKEQE